MRVWLGLLRGRPPIIDSGQRLLLAVVLFGPRVNSSHHFGMSLPGRQNSYDPFIKSFSEIQFRVDFK
jgi:hypothetical protein